ILVAVCERPDDDTPRLVFADWCDDHGDADYARFPRGSAPAPQWRRFPARNGTPPAPRPRGRPERRPGLGNPTPSGYKPIDTLAFTDVVVHGSPCAPKQRPGARKFGSDNVLPRNRPRRRRRIRYRLTRRHPRHTPSRRTRMTDRAALLAAVCDRPDDDTPRLVYADLLDDDGDAAQAAFIRTQVELARTSEHHPLWAKCRQLNPGVIRGWSMVHTLPKPLPNGFAWCGHPDQFRRGFAWLIGALGTEAVAAGGEELLSLAPIQAVSFDDRARPDLRALADSPVLARLRRLEFTTFPLDPDDLRPLTRSRHAEGLEELAFENQAVTPDGLGLLAASDLFPRLRALTLSNNALPPALLVDALAAADRPGELRRLTLSLADLPAADAAHLFALPLAATLEQLDLSENKLLGPAGVEALVESGLVRRLEVLKLEHTLPGVPGVKALTATGGLAGVRWLDLSDNRLGPNGVRLLAESKNARGLRVLDLSDNPLGDKGAELLAGARHLTGLVELNLKDCGITDAGAVALAESPHLGELVRLDVRDQGVAARPLGDAARRALVERFGAGVAYNDG
ncbi:TIGR02996 domain-containing protein, partial [bacterium]|nr:TIGR02996 domain-containing protein [bacterium]